MTTTTPLRVTQLREAEDLGEIAGRRWRQVASELCHPHDWTPTARKKWVALLTILHTNPYHDDDWFDLDPETRQACAHRFTQAFTRGDHAAQAEQRRAPNPNP